MKIPDLIGKLFKESSSVLQLNVEITGDGHESRCSAEEHSKLGQSGKVSEFLDQMW